TAIGAGRSQQERPQVGEVAALARGQASIPVNARRILSPGPPLRGRADAVAVDANDQTARQLSLQGLERSSRADHVGDVCALRLQVVELEHARIRLAAIRTPPGS